MAGRPSCVPSRADCLLPSYEAVAACVRLDAAGALVWRPRPADQFATVGAANKWNSQYSGKPVKGDRIAITLNGAMRRVEAALVTRFLATGTWPPPSNRRCGKRPTAEGSRIADAKLIELMAKHPTLGVRQLARTLNVTHPGVSRRITRLKEVGVVSRIDGAWVVDLPVVGHCQSWLASAP
jgi:hypothetical protein